MRLNKVSPVYGCSCGGEFYTVEVADDEGVEITNVESLVLVPGDVCVAHSEPRCETFNRLDGPEFWDFMREGLSN